MASSDELSGFVRDALQRGLSRREIDDVLRGAGWEAEQVKSALAAFADVDFPVPVPRPRPSLSARDAFLHLVCFAMLYVSAYQLGNLLFQLINRGFPDPAAQPWELENARTAIRWSVSSLIVAFPIFLYVSRLTAREARDEPGRHDPRVRRWLTYLTLFIVATVLVGDVIALVYNFLGGEITVRFILKALVAGVLAGSIFGHYLRALRMEEGAGGS